MQVVQGDYVYESVQPFHLLECGEIVYANIANLRCAQFHVSNFIMSGGKECGAKLYDYSS